jgi:hypothetical protein
LPCEVVQDFAETLNDASRHRPPTMLDYGQEDFPLKDPDRRHNKTMSQQHMQFDEEPELGGYRAASPPPSYQESRSAYDSTFEIPSAETHKPLSQPYPRSVRQLGLLLLVLGVILIFGLVLSMEIGFTALFVIITVVVDVLFFLGFWLLFRKRKIPAPHD